MSIKLGEQKTEMQLLMALRNRIISIGHSIKSPQVLFPARAEARTSYYRITNVSPVCSLMVSGALTSPMEQNFQLPLQRFPDEIRPASHDSPTGFHEVHKQCTAFPFLNKVYFSNNGNSSINASTSKYKDLHSSFPAVLKDLFFPSPATL